MDRRLEVDGSRAEARWFVDWNSWAGRSGRAGPPSGDAREGVARGGDRRRKEGEDHAPNRCEKTNHSVGDIPKQVFQNPVDELVDLHSKSRDNSEIHGYRRRRRRERPDAKS